MIRFHLLTLFLGVVGFCCAQTNESSVTLIDASGWTINNSPFQVSGSAHFYEGRILAANEMAGQPFSVVHFPGLWDKKENGMPADLGTYLIRVLLPAHVADSLALFVPEMYNAYRLYANGKLISTNGKVGLSKKETTPQWLPHTVSFKVTSDTLRLVLQIANFHHHKAGIKEMVFLGSVSQMNWRTRIRIVSNLIETSVLMLTGLFYLFIFFVARKKAAVLYFALLCIIWSVRSAFSNNYLFGTFYPEFSWIATIRIEYLTLFFTMSWAILFVGTIFQNETNLIVKYGLILANLAFAVFTLYAEPYIFTQGLTIYLITSGLLLLYVGFIVIRAWVNERTGSGLLTLSIILGLILFSYDIFVYQGFSTYNPVIFGSGYITIFMMLAWALAMQLKLVKSKPAPATSLTYEDLYKKKD